MLGGYEFMINQICMGNQSVQSSSKSVRNLEDFTFEDYSRSKDAVGLPMHGFLKVFQSNIRSMLYL